MPETIDNPPIAENPQGTFKAQMKAAANNDPQNPHRGIEQPQPPPREVAVPPVAPVPPVAAATPPPAVVKPAADPDEDFVSGKRAARKEDFKRVKDFAASAARERDEFKGKLENYEKELAELRKRPAQNADEIKELAAERDKYKGIHDTVIATQLPEFQQKYAAKIDYELAALKDSLPPDAFQKVSQILQLPESDWKRKALVEISENLDPIQVADVSGANRRLRDIFTEKNSELSKSQEIITQAMTARETAAKAHFEQRNKAFDSYFEKASKQNPMLTAKDGDDKWNSDIKERTEVAKAFYQGQYDGEELADAAFRVANYHVVVKQAQSQAARITELEGIVEKFQATNPEVRNGAHTAQGGEYKKGTLHQQLNADMARLQRPG